MASFKESLIGGDFKKYEPNWYSGMHCHVHKYYNGL